MVSAGVALEIALFGRPHVRVNGRERTLLSARTAWPILAELVERSPAPIARRSLAEAFWPDDEPGDALANVRRHLHLLRTATAVGDAPSPLVLAGDGVAWLTPVHARVDVERFETTASADATLAEAYSLFVDVYLRGFDGERVEAVRQRLQARFTAAAMRLCELAWRRRELDAAEAHARRVLVFEPWHEGAIRSLMMLRFECGDRPGALRVYESFAERLRDELDVEPMPETRAAFEHVVRNAPALHMAASAGGSMPESDAVPFVGRSAELAELAQAWARAGAGEGRVVFVAGEAGIGKSRLAAEFARAAGADGGTVLAGTASRPEAVPYQPFVEALRSGLALLRDVRLGPQHLAALGAFVPELIETGREPVVAGDGRERERLFEAVSAALDALARRRPAIVVLDDVHHCGTAALDLLAFLARRGAAARLLIVATIREGAVERRHRLRAVRRELVSEGRAATLALGPLPDAAIVEFARRTLPAESRGGAICQAVARQSEGNPFVAGELVRAYAAGAAPPSGALPPAGIVDRLIGARLGELSAPAQRLARLAACIGDEFSIEVLGEAAGFSERQTLDAVGELLDARIVNESSAAYGSLRFAHQLLASHVLEPVAEADRRRWHLRIATVMSDLYAARDDASASAIALHFERGGDSQAAATHYLAAARSAAAVFADDEAFEALGKAAVLATDLEARYEAIALGERVAFRRGDRDRSERELARLDRLACESGELARILDVLERRARWSRNAKSLAAADAILTLETIAACTGNPRAAAASKLAAAYLAFDAGRSRAAAELAGAAAESAGVAGNESLRVEATILKADAATALGELDDALVLIARAREAVTSDADRSLVLRALRAASGVALTRQEYDTARTLAEETLAICREIHDYSGEADALWRLAIACGRDGEVATSRAYFARAVALFERLAEPLGKALAHVNAANLEMRRGCFDLMERHLREVEATVEPGTNERLDAVLLNVRASAALLGGDSAAAEAIARDCVALCERLELLRYEHPARSTLGVALSRLGRHAEALAELRRSLDGERRLGQSLSIVDDLADNALAHLRAGDLEAATGFASELEARLRDPLAARYGDEAAHRWAAAQVRRALGDERGYERELGFALRRVEAEAARMPDEATRDAFLRLPHVAEIARAGARPNGRALSPGS
jgi:DNA-binding SARP family transcriptional activator/tetratricopeptide (TPR) repeat protein